jgi:hypothetical protein
VFIEADVRVRYSNAQVEDRTSAIDYGDMMSGAHAWTVAPQTIFGLHTAPVSVPVRFAAGIKPGRYMYVVVYSSPGFAMPVAVHEKTDEKSALVARNGVEL